MLRKHGLLLRLVLIALIGCGGFFGLGSVSVRAQATMNVVASQLNNPRGIDFAPDGSLYVAEAGIGGSGPCIVSSDGNNVCYGATGSITRVISGTQERLFTGLPSLAATGGGAATGPQDISLLQNGDAYVTIGLGANPDLRASLGVTGTQFGSLMRVDLAGATAKVADLAAYEKTNDPDGLGADSNPYAVLALPDRRLVVDAGGNDLLSISASGVISTVTTVPTRTVTGPGGPVDMQPVPNSLAIGPDGAYYLGELTGFPFPVGGARIYRIGPNHQLSVYASNLTNIIDMAFASDGSLYVLEIAANGLLAGPQGALIKIEPNGTQTPIVTSGLTAPTGIAISPEGGIYVTNNGLAPGQGEVVRVNLCAAGATNCSEPTPLATPLSTTLTGAAEVDNSGAPNKGDPDGQGTAIITLDSATNQACVQANISGIATPAAAHIHKAPAGQNGPVVVDFTTVITGTNLSGCVASTAELVADIAANPSNYYLNVHNADFPNGALRGQLADSDSAPVKMTVVAQGLNNPRGMSFAQNGALYVAEAGTGGAGPCITGPEGEQQCVGLTGSVTRIEAGAQTRVITGLASLAATGGNFATGPHDIAVKSNGDAYVLLGLGGNAAARATLGITGTGLGQLMRISSTGARQPVADMVSYEQNVDPVPAEGGPDSNPYSLISLGSQNIVADAGGNDVLRVDERGGITTVATFTERLVPAPPLPNLPPQIAMQAVPNAVAVGPDGAFYVGQLTGFPFPTGGARVYRVVPGQAPTMYAEGFTNIIDIAFGADGSLYVLELAAKGLLQAEAPGGDFTGALVRVAPNGTQAVVASTGLIAPTGLAIGPDGIYVATMGVFAGQGMIMRLDLCATGDTTCTQPEAQTDPLVASLSGAAEVDNTAAVSISAANKGDLDGHGSVIITIDPDSGQACVQGSVSGIAQPAAAHIHQGAAGTNGGVVVNFTTTISGSTLSGCVSADKNILASINSNPANFYFNVHNAEFPNGAVRGQLSRANAPAATHFLFLPIVAHQ